MGIREIKEFTKEQTTAIGQLVVDHWGANIQTGYDDELEEVYIYFKMGLNHRVKGYTVAADGEVVRR